MNRYLQYAAFALALCGTLFDAAPVMARSSTGSAPRLLAPPPSLELALAPAPHTLEPAPQFERVRFEASNHRRVVWGHALVLTGVVGILAGAAGMILLSSSLGKDQGPAARADPALARRYRRTQRGARALLFSGLGVGLGGLIAGPLLIGSGRRRQRALMGKVRWVGPLRGAF